MERRASYRPPPTMQSQHRETTSSPLILTKGFFQDWFCPTTVTDHDVLLIWLRDRPTLARVLDTREWSRTSFVHKIAGLLCPTTQELTVAGCSDWRFTDPVRVDRW